MGVLSNLSPFALLSTASLLCLEDADAWNLRRVPQSKSNGGRVLDETNSGAPAEWNFLVSRISKDEAWCMSVDPTDKGVFEECECDFDEALPEQLWKFHGNKLWNDLGNSNSRCVVLNHPPSDGVGMRLVDCPDSDDEPARSPLSDFYWADDDGYVQPLGKDDGAYCVTNRGPTAHAGDPILAQLCLCTRPDYRWTLAAGDPRKGGDSTYGGQFLRFELYAEGGCVQPKSGETAPGTLVLLDECNATRAWDAISKSSGVFALKHRQGERSEQMWGSFQFYLSWCLCVCPHISEFFSIK